MQEFLENSIFTLKKKLFACKKGGVSVHIGKLFIFQHAIFHAFSLSPYPILSVKMQVLCIFFVPYCGEMRGSRKLYSSVKNGDCSVCSRFPV